MFFPMESSIPGPLLGALTAATSSVLILAPPACQVVPKNIHEKWGSLRSPVYGAIGFIDIYRESIMILLGGICSDS